MSCSAKKVSASAVRVSRPSRIASCRSASSGSIAANIRRAACRSRFGVHRPPRAGTGPGRLGHQPLLGGTHLHCGRLGRRLLDGVEDHPHLLQSELTGRERLPGRGVGVAQQPRDPQTTGGLFPGAAGEPRQPGVGTGLRGLIGHPTPVGLGRQSQTQRRCPRLHPRQLPDRLAQHVAVQRLHGRKTGPRQTRPGLRHQAPQALLDHRRGRYPIEGDTHTCMVSNVCSIVKWPATALICRCADGATTRYEHPRSGMAPGGVCCASHAGIWRVSVRTDPRIDEGETGCVDCSCSRLR